jgi:DNA polymerase III subunit epsilon
MIHLQRPLAFFDLETTGLDITNDRIVEIAIVKMNPDDSKDYFHRRVNPEMEISAESAAIHGITNDMVKDSPTFRELAPEIAAFIGDADLGGYNSNKFDIPVLAEEFLRAGVDFDMSTRHFVDVQNIFHKMEQRTLAAAYQFYCNRELKNAHSALADIEATQEVFMAQLDRYENLEKDVRYLSEFSRQGDHKLLDFAGRLAINEQGEAIYNFGKHKGKTVKEVQDEEPGYYGWMLNANFPLYTKKVLRETMEKIKLANKPLVEKPNQGIEDKLAELKAKFGK